MNTECEKGYESIPKSIILAYIANEILSVCLY